MTVVNPMEVLKVRLQAQNRSKLGAESPLKYRNMAHAVYTIAKEEGVSALYSGIYLTVARQATNVSGTWHFRNSNLLGSSAHRNGQSISQPTTS